MLRFSSYKRPATLDEAYGLVERHKRARVLGGGAWLRLRTTPVPVAIDLSDCGLTSIDDEGDRWRLGAYVTLRQIELHVGLSRSCGGMLACAVGDIVGVQFRAEATVGGSVFGRYGFSDVDCALVALGAEIEFVGAGRMPLADFLAEPGVRRDVLAYIYIPKGPVSAGYQALRRQATDLPVLNACAVRSGTGAWRVAVGARPGRARLITLDAPAGEGLEAAFSAIKPAVEELPFGSNMWASAAYRRRIAPVLVRRAMADALGMDVEEVPCA